MLEIKNQLIEMFKSGNFPQGILLSSNNYNSIEEIAIDISKLILNEVNLKQNSDFLHLELDGVDDTRQLLSSLSFKSFNRRVVILGHAENLNNNSVNALLKTFEEPSKNNFLIVLTSSEHSLNSTLLSRLMIFRSNLVLDDKENENMNKFIDSKNITERILISKKIVENNTQLFLKNLYTYLLNNLNIQNKHRLELILNSFDFLKNNVSEIKTLSLLSIKW